MSTEAGTPVTTAVDGLVSTQWLHDRLDDPAVVVLEIGIEPAGHARYAAGHIPGSYFVYWKDLLWHDSDREFPSAETMATRLAALGVGEDSVVALVGDPFQFAAYAYWVMTMTGQGAHSRLVNGGRRTWISEVRALVPDSSEPAPSSLPPGKTDWSSRVGRDEVLAGLHTDGRLLLDMRSTEEYRGERVSPSWVEFDNGAERKGHIPGARHLYFEDLLGEDGALLPADQLRTRFETEGSAAATGIITYCRLSHRASLAWFILTRVLYYTNVRVYDGSWTEWGSIVGVPVERP
ncbi:MAG: sulfurtransferase [bacterium]|nr:sulfurtransferase [bacterium]